MGVHVPHFIDKFCIGHYKPALRAELILGLQLVDERKFAIQEEASKLIGITQTLQTWVHIARIAKVLKPN